MSEPPDETPAAEADGTEPPIPVVVHLSGRFRGTTERLSGHILDLGSDSEVDIHFPADTEPAVAPRHAVLYRSNGAWELAASAPAKVWVNGELLAEPRALASGDLLEIGEGGPILRFRLYAPGSGAYKTMAEAFADCRDCARFGADGAGGKTAAFLSGMPRELATQTAPTFRLVTVAVLLGLAVLTGALFLKSERLEERLEEEAGRVEGIAEWLAGSESRQLSAEDLERLRWDLEARVAETAGRVETLEERAEAGRRVIASASRSVVFLQGAYGFVEPASGRPLRLVLGPGGRPVAGPGGGPAVSAEGDGPVIEALYTGTAFVVSEDGLLLTNRHVGEPWEFEPAARLVAGQGFRPVMRRFVGYLPGVAEPFDVELVAAAEGADVAVLRCSGVTGEVPALPLAEEPPQPGDEVIVLGYPTGIQALLARAEESFVKELMREQDLDFWTVARRLSTAGHIGALATRGMVGQVTAAAIVYDAETTGGGSGGPVLDLEGRVVAVNAAILPQFGGSNLGVPAARAAALLDQAAAASPE